MVKIVCILSLVAVSLLGGNLACAITQGTETAPGTTDLQPGDYIWQPQVSPNGPVVIVVDLAKQVMEVYRGGELIGRSTIGAGKDPHPTPTGIFTILQKQTTHHSTKYHEASMPFMERLTWDGVAIHAGNVLGTPDSHGCIHLPMAFAKKLYSVTAPGATVLVISGTNAPQPASKPDLEFSAGRSSPVAAPSPQQPDSWHPEASPQGPVSVVYSSADRRVYVYRHHVEIGVASAGANGVAPPVANSIFAAQPAAAPDGSTTWKLLGSADPFLAPDPNAVFQQMGLPSDFQQDLHQAMIPGTTLVLTDQPVDKAVARDSARALFDTEAQP
jgi:hypothetical protein